MKWTEINILVCSVNKQHLQPMWSCWWEVNNKNNTVFPPGNHFGGADGLQGGGRQTQFNHILFYHQKNHTNFNSDIEHFKMFCLHAKVDTQRNIDQLLFSTHINISFHWHISDSVSLPVTSSISFSKNNTSEHQEQIAVEVLFKLNND